MGFILFIIATVLWLPLTIINILVVIWTHTKRKGYLNAVDGYFFDLALDIDIASNHLIRASWNKSLRTSGGYAFGKKGETISSALGKNQRDGTLSWFGKALCEILDFLDKDHCKNSIE